MRQRLTAFILILLVGLIISVCLVYFLAGPTMAYLFAFTNNSFIDVAPKEIFRQYVLADKAVIPTAVGQIQGLQAARLDPFIGPVYIRFKANNSFINEMIEKNYQFYNPYSEIRCDGFFEAVQKDYSIIQNNPKEFGWWKPATVTAPICYRSGSKSSFPDNDVAKYLLVDGKGEEVYFFRTITPLTEPD